MSELSYFNEDQQAYMRDKAKDQRIAELNQAVDDAVSLGGKLNSRIKELEAALREAIEAILDPPNKPLTEEEVISLIAKLKSLLPSE